MGKRRLDRPFLRLDTSVQPARPVMLGQLKGPPLHRPLQGAAPHFEGGQLVSATRYPVEIRARTSDNESAEDSRPRK